MALALLANTTPRLNQLIGATPGVWSASIVTGQVGAFPALAEITAALLEADGEVITRGYFNSTNNSLAQRFMAPSSPIERSGNIPFHYGNIGKVELSTFTGSVSPNTGTDEFTTGSDHGLASGDPVSFFGTAMPSPVVAGTTYYAIVSSSTVFTIASSRANVATATQINITTTGTSVNVIAWKPGIEAESIDDLQNANAVGNTYLGATNAFGFLWKIKDNCLFHATDYARVEVPTYTRTVELQADQAEETLIIALAVKNLTKNASPALFKEWTDIAEAGIAAIIRDGSYQPLAPDANA